jgi:hypothetical protein
MTPNDQHRIDQETIETLAAAVSKAMEQNHGSKRYLDLERIPLICLAISNISKALDEIKEMMASNRKESDLQHESFVTKTEFAPYKNALNKVAGTIIVALVMAVLGLILIINK